MDRKINLLDLRIVKIVNVILITLMFFLVWDMYYASRTVVPYYAKGTCLIIAIYVFLYVAFTQVYDAFEIWYSRISELIFSQILALLSVNSIMYVLLWLLIKALPDGKPMLVMFMVQIAIVAFWTLLTRKWYFKVFPKKKTMVIYDEREGIEKVLSEYGLDKKFEVARVENVQYFTESKMYELQEAEIIFLCGIHSHERNVILKYCIMHNIMVYVIPRIGDLIMSGAVQMHMLHLPILRVGRYDPTFEYRFVKRMFDVVVSIFAIVMLLPIFLVTAFFIKITDGGPVFYRQCRLTKNGKQFYIIKFRSMKVNAENDGKARLSTGDNDDRITPIGRIIRKLRIDELPQFINILKGDMSIVGPRPERPEIAQEYEKELPEFVLRLQAKAGLTGYAQVYGKYNTTPYDKLQMDLMYIAKPSFVEDLKIVLATIKILFSSESTDGVAVGQTTASKNTKDKGIFVEGKN